MVLPGILVELGRAVEFITVSGDTWEFPKNGHFVLASPTSGRGRLYIFSANFRRKTKKLNSRGQGLRSKFTGKPTDENKIVSVAEPKLYTLGRCKSVAYESDKYGRTLKLYEHKFGYPPIVRVDSKNTPRLVVISSGKIRITERGVLG